MSVKILSDFDGVWTDQAFEAENVKLYLIAEAARLARVAADTAREHFERFERIVKSDSGRYGWAPDGRITAYVDEDPFCEANSIAMYLEQTPADPQARRYREAVLAGGHESLSKFADHCFMTATSSFRTQHPPALVPRAAQMFAELVEAGAEVVVVSNSSSEKIEGWFRETGVGNGLAHALRVRGSAGKFLLGPSDEHLVLAGRRILVDRPKYRAILDEERPDLVIGDVYSLDLALPHVMRREGRCAARLALRRHPHTPRWVLDTRADGAIDLVVEQLDGLVEAVRGLARR
ncbi:MAG: hypothetical protein IT454_09710 [Planctomycetes bacterium]|nr:hypothetical protein [Planctomycetota bacterium]